MTPKILTEPFVPCWPAAAALGFPVKLPPVGSRHAGAPYRNTSLYKI